MRTIRLTNAASGSCTVYLPHGETADGKETFATFALPFFCDSIDDVLSALRGERVTEKPLPGFIAVKLPRMVKTGAHVLNKPVYSPAALADEIEYVIGTVPMTASKPAPRKAANKPADKPTVPTATPVS